MSLYTSEQNGRSRNLREPTVAMQENLSSAHVHYAISKQSERINQVFVRGLLSQQ